MLSLRSELGRTSRAQQASVPAIGFLSSTSVGEYENFLAAFRRGLSDSGYVEGKNVTIEYRWAEGQYDRLPALAADLVRRQVAVIAAVGGTPTALTAKKATAKIPIVFIMGDDPVRLGLVGRLSRPGGNLTGVSLISIALQPKRLELLRELVPKATAVAMLVNPSNQQSEFQSQILSTASRSLGLQLHILKASSDRDFEATYATCDPSTTANRRTHCGSG